MKKWKVLFCFGLFFLPVLAAADSRRDSSSFLSEHPGLQEHVFVEHPSSFSVGFGLVPLGVLKNQFLTGLNVVQFNWASRWIDWEILNLTIGFSFAQSSAAQGQYFLAFTKPKLRISERISIGVVGGFEFVTFPNLPAFIEKNRYVTPVQPFSANSLVYGFAASQYLSVSESGRLKITETVFRENYSTDQTPSGWTSNFSKADGNFDKSTIAPSLVFLIEVSFLM